MSVTQNKEAVKINGETFLEFLGSYHEAKWEANNWYDMGGDVIHANRKVIVNVFNDDDTEFSNEQLMKFKKYLLYQFSQYYCGKSEIRMAYELYVKVYGKKTRSISTQTEVSLSPNKKYFTNKC